MGRIVTELQDFALSLGAPGLFLIAVLDSSFMTLPEVNDILVVLMVTGHESRLALYAGAATLGSIAGSLVLYSIGRKGGEAIRRKRFDTPRGRRVLAALQRYGVMAIIVPSLLPPPMPFKMFVLLAGVSGMPLRRFAAAVGVGRGTRYFGEGLLALRYGDQTMTFLHEHSTDVLAVLAIAVTVGLMAYLLWTRAWASKSR
jgi:membrane protein YqaA with SNARE-associated domain